MKAYAVILGGGSGSRMGAGQNKIFLSLEGVPAIVRAVRAFEGRCAGAVVVAREGEEDVLRGLMRRWDLDDFVLSVARGGDTRQASVYNGLTALPEDAELALIHDGARALVTGPVIDRALRSAAERGSGVAAVPITDTIKRAGGDGLVSETLNREELYAVQTPQAFRLPLLMEAHRRAMEEGFSGTDDASLLERAGMPVYLSPGDKENLKLTTPADLTFARAILASRREGEKLL